jgi:hypothetical protein
MGESDGAEKGKPQLTEAASRFNKLDRPYASSQIVSMIRVSTAWFLLFSCFSAFSAEVRVPVLHAGEMFYTNAIIRTQSLTHVSVTYNGGVAMVPIKKVDPSILKQLGYDASQSQAGAGGVGKTSAASAPSPAATVEAMWLRDQGKAFKFATEQKKNVLIYYTPTDTPQHPSPLSKVFYEPDFVGYARNSLILLRQPAATFLQHPGTLEYASATGDTIGILARSADDYQSKGLLLALEQLNKAASQTAPAKPAK